MQAPPLPHPPRWGKILDQASDAIRVKHYSSRTEKTYKNWIKRYTTIQELLEHKDVKTTMIYTHVL